MKAGGSLLGGIGLGVLGIALLCAMDATVKGLGAHLGTFEIAFVRFFGAVIWLALFLVVSRQKWPARQHWPAHAIRGLLMTVTACLFFYGVTNLPLAVVAALGLTAPIYIAVLGILLLGERPSLWLAGAVVLGLSGALVVVLGGDALAISGSDNILAWAAAIAAPLTYALALVLLKHHSGGDEGPAQMTFAQSSISAAVLLPLAFAGGFTVPDVSAWWLIVLVGFLGAAGFLFLIAGLKRMPASVFAVLDYSSLLWASAYGFVLFHEVPAPQTWVGGGLIIAACVVGAQAGRKLQPAQA